MVVAEGIVRIDHGDLLADIRRDPRRHRTALRAHIGNAGLEHVAVHLAGCDVVALAHHVIRHLEFAGCRRGTDHHMTEQRSVDDVGLVLVGEFLHHLGAARGIRAVILGDDLDRASVDAAGIVDAFDGRGGRTLVPAPVGGTDAGAVCLEADPDRFRRLRLCIAHEARRRAERGGSAEPFQRAAPGNAGR